MRVLIIDDDTLNRRLLRSMLETGGLTVSEAANGPDALEVLGKIDFDLVLMDLRMPFMDGLEATRIIRERSRRRLPIAIITADRAEGLDDRCRDAGADVLIRKPLNMGELHDAIGRLVVQAEPDAFVLH